MPRTRITFNLEGAKKRYETLGGRQYTVLPFVSLTEGVHTGSEGPLYYPRETLAKNPQVWNNKPIVVYHPTQNGQGVSACSPDVLDRQGVGTIFNSDYDGRLKGEAWIDEDKLKRVDKRVYDAINEGKMVEVSTGLYYDNDPTPGVWNEKPYNGSVRGMGPDHLAILPDQKGACSIEDGAGLLRNAEGEGMSYEDIRAALYGLLREEDEEYCFICDIYPKSFVYECEGTCYKCDYKVKGGKVTMGEPEEVRKLTSYVTVNGRRQPLDNSTRYMTMSGKLLTNDEDHQGPLKLPKPNEGELSDVMRHQQHQKALEEHYSGVQQEGDWGGWVTDVVANYVVWIKDGKYFRLPYTYDDDKIRYDGEPEEVEVERASTYRAKNNIPIDGTQSPSYNLNKGKTMPPTKKPAANAMHQGAHEMFHEAAQADAHHPAGHEKSDGQTRTLAGGARKDEVNKMIAGGHAKEEDRKFLEGLPDDHFESVQKFVMKGATDPIVPYSYEGVGDRSAVHGKAENKQATAEEFIANAPPEIASMLRNALATEAREKGRLVKIIRNNKQCVFSEKYLLTKEMDELRGLATLAGRPALPESGAYYGGQADVQMFAENAGRLLENTDAGEPDGLPLPTLDFPRKETA